MPNPSTIAMEEDYGTLTEHTTFQPLTTIGTGVISLIQAKELESKIKDLAAVARAADRYLTASRAFLKSEAPTEDMAHEAGEAEAELEKLLEAHAALFR